MRYLLDTHVLLWLANEAERVPVETRNQLAQASGRVVSSASAMEIALKTRLGRLTGGHAITTGWQRVLSSFLADELPLSGPHMLYAGGMDWAHRDPFDRMLVAQALLEGLVLVTLDRAIIAHAEVETLSW
ncbi:type II toxin-antitoxin system VapC family toxin [Occultella glacieicola]|nr:type II toxin-antitoxin system VapC family toxin [Occultella glacieicola]